MCYAVKQSMVMTAMLHATFVLNVHINSCTNVWFCHIDIILNELTKADKHLLTYLLCCSIYAARGQQYKRSYHYVHKTSDGDEISFIAVDACPDPGPRRPFNFFGVLSAVNLIYKPLVAIYIPARWLTLWRPLLPYGYSYKAACARLG